MANDLLTTYKYGWKTSYYQNTNDLKSDEIDVKESLDKLLGDCSIEQEEDCESCKI
jgi:ribonucleoside-diphosphate reductase alpha chain